MAIFYLQNIPSVRDALDPPPGHLTDHFQLTHPPNTPSEGHWIGHPIGDASGAKAEAIITNLPSGVRPQGTVASIVVASCSRVPQAEIESVIALTVGAPPRRAPAGSVQLTAVAIAVFVRAVTIVYSTNLESVGGLQLDRLQKRIQ